MDERTEEPSTSVPGGNTRRTQQVEEIRARWAWVKPSVWTVPMLTALEQGVKGGKWFRLNDKVFAERNLATEEEHPETTRSYPSEDTPDDRAQHAVHDCRREQNPQGLVRVLSAQQLQDGLQRAGRLGATAIAEHAPTLPETSWTSTRTGHAAVAKCVLCQAGAVQSVNRPCHGRSILTEVRPSTGEPCAVDLHARFGGRGARTQSGLPTPIKRYRHLILSWFRAGGYDFIRRQRWNQRQVTCPHE